MDTDVACWILDFILRQHSVHDRTLNSILTALPLPPDNLNLSKAILLRGIEAETRHDGSVSENILDLLELLEELDRVAGNPATDAIKRAYCSVAVECTTRVVGDAAEYFEAVKRNWRGRVGKMGECGLGSDELVELRDEVEAAVWDPGACERVMARGKGIDAMGAVRVYVAEAWEGLGPSFIEVVAGMAVSDGGVREVLGSREGAEVCKTVEILQEEMVGDSDMVTVTYDMSEVFRSGGDQVLHQTSIINSVNNGEVTNDTTGVLPSGDNQVLCQHLIINNVNNVVSQKGTLLSRHKHVAKKRSRGSVAGTCRGANITDTEQVDNRDLYNSYGCLPSPAISEGQEALRDSSFELQAMVNDPRPEALQLAENVVSSKNADSWNPEVQENVDDLTRQCTSHQNKEPKSSLMTWNSTARTYELT